jgi:hypothetical protein
VSKISRHSGRPYEAAGPEAQAIINRFDGGIPYVQALARLCTKSAQGKGYIKGIDDRRLRFELLPDGQLKDEHKALNKLIQYAAAWQTKMALVRFSSPSTTSSTTPKTTTIARATWARSCARCTACACRLASTSKKDLATASSRRSAPLPARGNSHDQAKASGAYQAP